MNQSRDSVESKIENDEKRTINPIYSLEARVNAEFQETLSRLNSLWSGTGVLEAIANSRPRLMKFLRETQEKIESIWFQACADETAFHRFKALLAAWESYHIEVLREFEGKNRNDLIKDKVL